MKWRKINVHDFDVKVAEFADETPARSFCNTYFIGILVAILLVVQGVNIIIDKHASIPFTRRDISVYGDTAVAFGVMWAFMALFIHFQFTWGTSRKLYPSSDFGKVVSLIGFSCSLFYAFWQIVSKWLHL